MQVHGYITNTWKAVAFQKVHSTIVVVLHGQNAFLAQGIIDAVKI